MQLPDDGAGQGDWHGQTHLGLPEVAQVLVALTDLDHLNFSRVQIVRVA